MEDRQWNKIWGFQKDGTEVQLMTHSLLLATRKRIGGLWKKQSEYLGILWGCHSELHTCTEKSSIFNCEKTWTDLNTRRKRTSIRKEAAIHGMINLKPLVKIKKLFSCKIHTYGTFLVAQWLRIRLSLQGTRVQALVREDPTSRTATKPVHHNYWACALEPMSHNYWAHVPQLLKPTRLEPVLHNKRSHCNEKPAHCNKE